MQNANSKKKNIFTCAMGVVDSLLCMCVEGKETLNNAHNYKSTVGSSEGVLRLYLLGFI